jgi:hypothetical protein
MEKMIRVSRGQQNSIRNFEEEVLVQRTVKRVGDPGAVDICIHGKCDSQQQKDHSE